MNLILIGNKSAGKSSVGQALSKMLQCPLLDTDQLLCQQQSVDSCADLFINVGEKKFRQLESKLIQNLQTKNSIIVTGGGSLLDKENAKHLKKLGQLVYLQVDFDTLQQRNKKRDQHGILSIDNCKKSQFVQRDEIFHQYADRVINCNNKTETEVAILIKESCLFL